MAADTLLPAAVIDETRWSARLQLGIERRAQGSVLVTRRHEGPLRVQKTLYPEGPDLAHLVLVHPPGGIAGGDRLHIELELAAGAQALLTTPGATKWYKANGVVSGQDTRLTVAGGALLEWLPQENIFFDGAYANMHLHVACTTTARACGWEVSVLGRRDSHEQYRSGRLRQRVEIVRDGQLLWAERGQIEGGDALLDSPLGWAGAHVSGLFWALGVRFDDALLETCRTCAQGIEGVRLGVTRFPHGLLLARVLGSSPEQVRSVLTSVWMAVRPVLSGRAGLAPRIWAT